MCCLHILEQSARFFSEERVVSTSALVLKDWPFTRKGDFILLAFS